MYYENQHEPPYMGLVAPDCDAQVPILSVVGKGPKGDKGDKGDTGDTGATGEAAGFGVIEASVDDNVGVPYVDVIETGTDQRKNLNFQFHNLKGRDSGELPLMDATHIGGAKLGSGLRVDGLGKLNLAPPDGINLGGVKPDGTSIRGAANGVISVPTMSANTAGIARAGVGVVMNNDILNLNLEDGGVGTLPPANGGTGVTTRPLAQATLGSIPMGTCADATSSATTVTKEVDLPGFLLFAGARILVLFTHQQEIDDNMDTDAALSMIVNDSAEKLVYAAGNPVSSLNQISWEDGAICEFIYDGTQWHYLGNSIDGYADYEANQAIADNAAAITALQSYVSHFSVVNDNGVLNASFDFDANNRIVFVYNPTSRALNATVKINGAWTSQKAIAQW